MRGASGLPTLFFCRNISHITARRNDMAEPIISFKDYGFQYLAQASPTLYHINLDIYPGEKC